MEQNNTYRWIPKAGNTYKPLLRKNLFVTKILAAKVISDDEALAYFVAAPTRNFSYRFLYRTKVVYPPLGYSTLEAVDCLTCPEIERGRSVSSNGGDYERPSSSIERGFRSICLWSEVLMSRTARNYILKCRGPNFPWSAVFSTDTNLRIRYLSYQENFSSWYSSRMHTSTYDFEVELDDGFLAQARLHLPPDWKNEADQCNSRIKLILRLANQPNGQMVTTKYDTSLATYLPIAGPYAVLYADVRSSKFHNLDFAGLRFRRRETMQMEDYTRVANHIADKFQCIDAELGFGVLGEAYGGHMALNLAADNSDNGKAAGHFQCSVALKPFADWQLYLDTFTGKPFGRVVSRTRRKKLHSALARRLRGKDFILYTSESRRRYTDALLELLAQNRVVYEHRRYEEHCDSRLYFYRQIREYFDRCFQRHSLGIDKF